VLSLSKRFFKIPEEIIHQAMENFQIRLQVCVRANGAHLKDVIFKKLNGM
jgi:hypothetical protein